MNGTVALVDDVATSIHLKPPSFLYGGAVLVSTARRYDRSLHMFFYDGRLGSRRILSTAAARLAKERLRPPGVFMTGSGPVAPGEPVGEPIEYVRSIATTDWCGVTPLSTQPSSPVTGRRI